MENQKMKYKKFCIGIVICCCTLIVIYLGTTVYFTNHFYVGSSVNCISVSCKTVKDVEVEMPSEVEAYSLELDERGDVKEEIGAADIGIHFEPGSEIQNLKDSQNPFGWVKALFNKQDYDMPGIINYDEELLNKALDSLSCFNSNNIVNPQNPTFKYESGGYVIVDEVYGNKINKDILRENVVKAIVNGETKINLEEVNCYEKPQYTSASKEIQDTKILMDKYTASNISYKFGGSTEVLNGATISSWIQATNNLEVTLDEGKVREYVDKLASSYDTIGKTRDFKTTYGSIIKVSGGNYGWCIDKSSEIQELIANIKEGKSIEKEPKYIQTAITYDVNDIGNTYVEVNLSSQHLWCYKNGNLIAEGDIVTGNVSSGCGTPAGTYVVDFKQRNAVLKGPNYSAPVSYWMPFNGGIGLHDASWRSTFGGSIYMTNGSHGCVNAPYYLASKVFENIEAGTPVICYY